MLPFFFMLAVRTQSFVEEIFFMFRDLFSLENRTKSFKIPLRSFQRTFTSKKKRTLDLLIFSSCFSFSCFVSFFFFAPEKIPKMIFYVSFQLSLCTVFFFFQSLFFISTFFLLFIPN